MDDLFTILIILAFIISFLNKIFGKKKQQQTTRRQPAPQQKPPEWFPTWLQADETEVQLPVDREEELDITEEIEQQQPSRDRPEQQKVTPAQPIFSEKKIVTGKRKATFRPEVTPLKSLDIELSSRDDLKRGIVLAEILGPCRARRRLKRTR